jgi:hypothetical protein
LKQNYDNLVRPGKPVSSPPYRRDRQESRYPAGGNSKSPYNYPKKNKVYPSDKPRTDTKPRPSSEAAGNPENPAKKKTYAPKKKTIYNGPDVPRITIKE